ncbi:MAG: hypothetical protein ABJG15_06300 [Hyphomonadaceae bacterium]
MACATSLSAPPAPLALPELNWFPDTPDRVDALTRLPAACLRPAPSAEISAELELGALIFSSPALLGGQAEKKGLSCGSCHRNGRSNPHFQFEAISGPAGTADVTSGLFSKARADNVFNPVAIPDLALPEGRDQVDRTDRASLEIFVRGQIEDEFSGDPPTDEMLAPLLTYLQYIGGDAAECAADAPMGTNWQRDWDDAELAAMQIPVSSDPLARAFYIRTARLSLGQIHDRYNAPSHAEIRAALIDISRNLAAGEAWPEDTNDLRARLKEGAQTSLYNADALSRALQLLEG